MFGECDFSSIRRYSWCSPRVLGGDKDDDGRWLSRRTLVPFGTSLLPRIVIGHNVGYDRARILEQYNRDVSVSCDCHVTIDVFSVMDFAHGIQWRCILVFVV
jgi:hypothetical protein